MTSLKTLIFGRSNRIGQRLIVFIIAFSTLITLLISAGQLAMEYRSLRSAIDRDLNGLHIYVPTISGSVWNFDEKQIQLALDAMVLLPNMDRVKVIASDNQKQWMAGRNAAPHTAQRTFPLMYESGGQKIRIGTLEVVASLDNIYRQVVSRAVSIVFSNGVKTFLVAIFMTYLFRQLVTGRLEALSRKVNRLHPKLLPMGAEEEAASQQIPEQLDELEAVDWVLDRTARNLEVAVTALQHLNAELNEQVAEKEAILQNALVGIVMLRERTIVSCNARFEEIFGYDHGEMIGQSTEILYLDADAYNAVGDYSYSILGRGLNFGDTMLLMKRDGTQFWGEINGRAFDAANPHAGSIWIYADINERKLAEQKIAFIAYHDALTGLPNRLLAHDRFQQAKLHADREESRIALVFLDIDNFKTINDSLGHAIGDALIKQVAARLRECVRETDTISRQGGDEFLIVLPKMPDIDTAETLLASMMQRITEPFSIDSHELNTSISVGLAFYPDDGVDFDTLMKKADMAMYRAKDAGRNTYRFFDEQMNIEAIDHLNMRNGLHRALERGEFRLHYQPQIDLDSGALVGFEALIRWEHPESGLVPPARFISIAEDSGLIVPIGEWVLREACRQAVAWQQPGMPKLVMAVNLSAVQFKHGNLEQSVINALQESGIEPHLLELELTESLLIHDTESILATVRRLKLLGVKLSIDDFGTGYSSLSYLKRFQVDKLKVDQSFVRNLATDPEDAAIVRTIIQMAKSFGLRTIAEGVEDERALTYLRAFGCDEVQGYFFSRPLPSDQAAAYLFKMQGSVQQISAG